MNKTFNYYCDESTHLEHDSMPYMLISYVCVPINQVRAHSAYIKRLKEKYYFKGEIKWSNVSKSQYPFYSELIEYFFGMDINFRAVVIEKKKIDNTKEGFSYDDFYFKMYWQLLYHKMDLEHSHNIYLDIKDTCSAKKIEKLGTILKVHFDKIRTIQPIHSYESNLMQLTDLLMGAINYNLRGLNKVIAKTQLIEKIKKQSGMALDNSTRKSENKFNLFFIDLNSEK